jgi:beta-N-acetylhexosaminidase
VSARAPSRSLAQLASACIFPGAAGLAAPDWLRREVADGLGGVVLFSRNVRDREQLAALTASLRAERDDVLVGIDEEGGDVTRLEAATGSSYPGNLALGSADDAGLTRRVAESIAAELADVGVNFDLAPVADVNTNPRNPVIGVRSFGSDPALVARHVAAFVIGLQTGGVVACAKHFPGHGSTEQDSHLELPTVATGLDRLRAEELVPFRAAIAAGVRSIMTAHIVVPALDERPATISRAHLHDLLRVELGFEGVVITDALEMRAISATVGVEQGAVLALAAGADALCLGHDLEGDAVRSVHDAIVSAVGAGELAEERLAEAAGRVREAGAWSRDARARPRLDREAGLAAARLALRTEGDPHLGRSAFVVECVPAKTMAADPARHGLGELVRERDPAAAFVRLEAGVPDLASLLAAADGRRLVLVVRDAQRHEWERALGERLVGAHPEVVVVDVGYPGWRPEGAAGYITTFGAGRVNLIAAAEVLLLRP